MSEKKPQTETTVVKRRCTVCGYELRERHMDRIGWVEFEMPTEADHNAPSDCIAKLGALLRNAESEIERLKKDIKKCVREGSVIPMSCDKHKWWWQR